MNRLIAFGCSNTYGYGLPDCFIAPDNPGPTASKMAWPALLADSLQLRCVNTAQPGASNLEILNNILNYKFMPTDTVVVLWTYQDRDMIFNASRGNVQVGHWSNFEYVKEWMHVHTTYDLKMRSWLYMHHAHLYLTSLNIKFAFANIDRDNIIQQWASDIKFLKTNFGDYTHNPKALDQYHPGTECHRQFAHALWEEINGNVAESGLLQQS